MHFVPRCCPANQPCAVLSLCCSFQYEEEVNRNPLNYDNWFDYIKLEEEAGDVDRVREVRLKGAFIIWVTLFDSTATP